jgi:PAS domain S-box-containing protein
MLFLTKPDMKNGKIKIPLIYLLIGLIWVPIGNMGILSLGLQEKSELVRLIIVGKGMLFVLATSFLLYILIAREQRRIISNERQYSDIYESNPNPIWFYDPDTFMFVSVNQAAIDGYGYSRGEFLSMNIMELRPYRQVDAMEVPFNNLPIEPDQAGIWKHRKKDGSLLYVRVSAHKMLLNDKEVIMVMAIDTTDKFLYEKQLKKINKELTRQKAELDRNYIRQQNILSSIAESFFTMDIDHIITDANDNFYKVTGISRTAIGRAWEEVIPESRNSPVYLEVKSAIDSKTVMNFETFSAALNKWLSISVYPEDGETTIYFTDITVQKEKDIELKLALERYDIASRATGEVIYDWDLATDGLVFSKEISTLVQVPAAQIGDNLQWWRSRVHPDDLEQLVMKNTQSAFSKDKFWNAEYRILTGSGKYKYVMDQCNLTFDKELRPVRAIGAVRDIDLLKRSVDQLKTMGDILNRISSSVIISDPLGIITWVNPGFSELKGYSYAEALGQPHAKFLSGKGTDDLRVAQIREALLKKEAYSAEISNHSLFDKEYWVTLNISPIFDMKGELECFISVENDITERKEKEALLQEQEEKLHVVSWLNSHQLRRPVASILGLSSLMRMTDNKEEKEELFELLCHCTVELDDIIHQINEEASGQTNRGNKNLTAGE